MAILTGLLNTLVIVISLFLICVVLIQRGKGGGLAGAFGGMGGSSAFGTKAGDVFTRVTIVVAVIWIFMNMTLDVLYNRGAESAWGNDAAASSSREIPSRSKATGAGKAPKGRTAPSTSKAPAGSSSSSSPVSVPAIPNEKAK